MSRSYNEPFPYSLGNKKIGQNTIIFNMNPAKNCPSKLLGLCKHPKRCYANVAERLYPACLPFRLRQELYWDSNSTEAIANNFLTSLMRHKKVKYIRFSEAGDFKSQKDVDKFYQIADILYGIKPNITIYGYTSRKDLLYQTKKNVILAGTGFTIDNQFTPVDNYGDSKRTGLIHKCANNCKICDFCKKSRGIYIETLYH